MKKRAGQGHAWAQTALVCWQAMGLLTYTNKPIYQIKRPIELK
jgi:hypothetical protein